MDACRFKTANLNSKNFYDLLGIEKVATQKQIKQAFFKLSKEYHPDSNPNDKSLHGKFVKINEAYNILSKQSSRTTYDQMLNNSQALAHRRQYESSSSSYPNEDPFINISRQRKQYQQQQHTIHGFDWGSSPHWDSSFAEMLRKQMERNREKQQQDEDKARQRYGHYNPTRQGFYLFPSLTIIVIIISLGVAIHALQSRQY
ncbi:unnamed protein product [Didymodactylos carnosus]|uniref:J domain-containing protein n=1 Tax=Didymodactylos carnosus TaxID=1234261 RepID=A0A815H798_9BILA|nr:unnamed protein product [Didymodactylos carnosus]CAF1347224.1 unnamed protein product [Didymodactylos carnosus]CAF3902322.1 unnamed protein product [Didymodactylos carnosus]CAF4214105.1 unnamed protein product [Didymodactylos carnosus]